MLGLRGAQSSFLRTKGLLSLPRPRIVTSLSRNHPQVVFPLKQHKQYGNRAMPIRSFASSSSNNSNSHDDRRPISSPWDLRFAHDSLPTEKIPKPPVIYALSIEPPFRPLLRGVPISTTINGKETALIETLVRRHKKGQPSFIGVFLGDRKGDSSNNPEEPHPDYIDSDEGPQGIHLGYQGYIQHRVVFLYSLLFCFYVSFV